MVEHEPEGLRRDMDLGFGHFSIWSDKSASIDNQAIANRFVSDLRKVGAGPAGLMFRYLLVRDLDDSQVTDIEPLSKSAQGHLLNIPPIGGPFLSKIM